MDFGANIEATGRAGRIARFSVVACLLVACGLLLTSVVSPTEISEGSLTSRIGSMLSIF